MEKYNQYRLAASMPHWIFISLTNTNGNGTIVSKSNILSQTIILKDI